MVLCLFPRLVVVEVQVVVQSHKTLVFKPDPFKGSLENRPEIMEVGSPNKSLENYFWENTDEVVKDISYQYL